RRRPHRPGGRGRPPPRPGGRGDRADRLPPRPVLPGRTAPAPGRASEGPGRPGPADRPEPALLRHRPPARPPRALPPRTGRLPGGHEVLRPRPHVPGHDRVRAGPLRRRRDRRRPRLRRPRGPHAPGDRSLRRLGPVRHPRRPAGRRRRLLRGSGTPPPAARRPRGGGHAHRGRTGGRLLRLVTDSVSSGRSPYALANATGGATSPPGVITSGS